LRKILAIPVLIVGVGALLAVVQGCKRTAPAPAQPAVRKLPPAPQPYIPGPLPVDHSDVFPVKPQPAPRHAARPVQPQNTDAQDAAAAAAAQRRVDARLLQQQQTASRQQQQELNHQVQKAAEARARMEDEPRIQDVPEPPGWSGFGPDAHRIQDAPGPDQGQSGPDAPRIQDAPGPTQPQPAQPPPQR